MWVHNCISSITSSAACNWIHLPSLKVDPPVSIVNFAVYFAFSTIILLYIYTNKIKRKNTGWKSCNWIHLPSLKVDLTVILIFHPAFLSTNIVYSYKNIQISPQGKTNLNENTDEKVWFGPTRSPIMESIITIIQIQIYIKPDTCLNTSAVPNDSPNTCTNINTKRQNIWAKKAHMWIQFLEGCKFVSHATLNHTPSLNPRFRQIHSNANIISKNFHTQLKTQF